MGARANRTLRRKGAPSLRAQSDNIAYLAEISKNAKATFFTIVLACAYCYLTIGMTTDAALLSNVTMSTLPIIQVKVPIIWFYYVAPFLILLMYLYFHLYLQRFWRGVVLLPLFHEDGRSLDDYVYPWLISSAFVGARIHELKSRKRAFAKVESMVCVFLAWWLVPLTLLFFWGRYLIRHDWMGTAVHIVFLAFATAAAVAFYCVARDCLRRNDNKTAAFRRRVLQRARIIAGISGFIVAGTLSFLSYGAIEGAPFDRCETSGDEGCSWPYAGGRVFDWIGHERIANFEERDLSERPPDWYSVPERDASYLATVRGADLRGADLRHGRGSSAFLVQADLRDADLRWARLDKAELQRARLENANLSGARLSEAQLQWARLDQARFSRAELDQANLRHAGFERGADFRESILDGADLRDVVAKGADFSGADLRFARFNNADLKRANLQGAQLAAAEFHDNAEFNQADFEAAALQLADFEDAHFGKAKFDKAVMGSARVTRTDLFQATFNGTDLRLVTFTHTKANESSFLRAHLQGATFKHVDLREAIFREADLTDARFEDADLRRADFTNATLTRTEFRGSNLSGAAFKETVDLTQGQLDAACGNRETKLPPPLRIRDCQDVSGG